MNIIIQKLIVYTLFDLNKYLRHNEICLTTKSAVVSVH